MKKGERFLITTEKHKLTVLRRRSGFAASGSCEICGAAMVSVDEAVMLSGRGTSDLLREATSGNIHSVETPAGHLLICIRSLHELPAKPRS